MPRSASETKPSQWIHDGSAEKSSDMAFQIARKLKATVLGMDASDPKATEELEAAGVPVSEADCRSCADPCDEGALR